MKATFTRISAWRSTRFESKARARTAGRACLVLPETLTHIRAGVAAFKARGDRPVLPGLLEDELFRVSFE